MTSRWRHTGAVVQEFPDLVQEFPDLVQEKAPELTRPAALATLKAGTVLLKSAVFGGKKLVQEWYKNSLKTA
ncbi:hypothetical protein [Oligosphaera ethanolica]|uniref:Uncharacterized protein n=1 Tax=Oligosphaera ethanolica TaxID=760260 RepID=A0AAE3VCH6_9BACT|nr:hypothetical protein [Oligosphaera ethanolica]MDQ0287973.1 hypothetical protein [Oligosphaera ethanolica]